MVMSDEGKTREQLTEELAELRSRIAGLEDIAIKQKRAEQRLSAQYAIAQILAESSSLIETVPKILRAISEEDSARICAIAYCAERRCTARFCMIAISSRP